MITTQQKTEIKSPIMNRVWAMPSPCSFSIPPIKNLIASVIEGKENICDPFSRNNPFADRCVTNDLDPSIVADFHMDALDFLRTRETNEFDVLLFDPPYSPHQVSECYKKFDQTVNFATTNASFWGNLKKEISRVVKANGIVMTFSWNSGGIGKGHGFSLEQILLVAHGGWHNDTIVTVERKHA